jgi:phosphoribosylanthranilate isomerase
MKIKICGITNKEDAVWAINYGADYIGLNFYKDSPRHVSFVSANKWVPELPSFASLVGVFVDEAIPETVKIVDKLKLKGVQLHGAETPETITLLRVALEGLGRPVFIMKGFRMRDESSLRELEEYQATVDYFLLDAYVEDQMGGTGTVFNWDLAVKAKDLGKPIFLAGGLTPENVREAGKKVAPYAVDVASGVEKSPKRKDVKKVEDFIRNAKSIR